MNTRMGALDGRALKQIARSFLPSRWHYHYVRSKLATDPLFAGVAGALKGVQAPLLDLGCGVGLLAHYLAACGNHVGYLGLDNDARKIQRAKSAASRAGLTDARFERIDLAEAMAACTSGGAPELSPLNHQGSVVILDVLQFLPPDAQAPLLRHAAACVAPGGRLVIRTGLAGTDWRARTTRAVDRLSRWLRWMNTGPKAYPVREELDLLLRQAGLDVRFAPLWGGTPFNNWLVVAELAEQISGTTQR